MEIKFSFSNSWVNDFVYKHILYILWDKNAKNIHICVSLCMLLFKEINEYRQ